MSEKTWGYSNPVGEWVFRIQLPDGRRDKPEDSFFAILRSAAAAASLMHRLRSASMSWGEYDAEGREQEFHELEEVERVEWEGLEEAISAMLVPSAPERRVAVSCLFLTLDTEVVSSSGLRWADDSAELQLSFVAPELHPTEASLMYSTSIDVWLPITLDAELKPRSNRELSRKNQPRLEALLSQFASLSSSATSGQSRLYGTALHVHGFRN